MNAVLTRTHQIIGVRNVHFRSRHTQYLPHYNRISVMNLTSGDFDLNFRSHRELSEHTNRRIRCGLAEDRQEHWLCLNGKQTTGGHETMISARLELTVVAIRAQTTYSGFTAIQGRRSDDTLSATYGIACSSRPPTMTLTTLMIKLASYAADK